MKSETSWRAAIRIGRPIELQEEGRTIWAAVTAALIRNDKGEICGREGTLTDITTQERYRNLINEMPIGLYLTKRRGGEEFFRRLQRHLCPHQRIWRAADLRNKRVSIVHRSPEEYRKFLTKVEAAEHPYRSRIPIRHDHKTVEVLTKVFRRKSGEIAGRVGAGRDVTADEGNREWLEVISRYIGNVLHTYQSSLISLELAALRCWPSTLESAQCPAALQRRSSSKSHQR